MLGETTTPPDLRSVRVSRDYWFPVALSKELKLGCMLAAQFSDEPLVIARTSAGSVFALEDRCAHRQVPLTKGTLIGNRIQCAYHGRCYDSEGHCSLVAPRKPNPGLPGVRAFPVREQSGLVFVFPGDPSKAADVPLPSLEEAESNAFFSIPFRREVRCHYSFLHENLMDMSHQILHRRWTGDFRPRLLRMRSGDSKVEVDYSADLRGGSLLLRLLPSAILRFQSGRRPAEEGRADEVTITTDYPYQSLVLHRAGIDEPILKLWNAYVPVGQQEKVTRPIGLLLVRRPSVAGLLPVLKPLLVTIAQRIFNQDRAMMELEQRAHDLQGYDCTQEAAPFMLELRQLLRTHGLR